VLLKYTFSQWVPEHESICIKQHLVWLSILDVCVCLGLNGVGDDVRFDSLVCGVIGSLFEHQPITIDDIVDRIYFYLQSDDEDDDVDNMCHLYLLLYFALLYFPRTSRTMTNMPFRLLDNFDNLNQYNWAWPMTYEDLKNYILYFKEKEERTWQTQKVFKKENWATGERKVKEREC